MWKSHRSLLVRCSTYQRGASSIEYALLGSLIAAVIVLTVTQLGTDVLGLFEILPF